MAAKVKASAKSKEKDVLSAELIVARFQQMRAEQRAIVGKIAEVEADRKKHRCASLSLSIDLVLFRCSDSRCSRCTLHACSL